MQLSGTNSLVLLVLLVAVIFGFAVAEAMGAPIPLVNQQLLIGLLIGGVGGSAGTAALQRRDTRGGDDSRAGAGERPVEEDPDELVIGERRQT